MNAQTLVLDANYRPIDIFDWKKAVKKILGDRAEMLEAYVDDEIGEEWKSAMECPSVIRLLHFIQKTKDYRRFQKLTRRNVLLRDNHECQYCSCHLTTKNLSWDHVVPRDMGGKTTWQNIVSACQKCNIKKANKSLADSGMILKKKPFAPKLVAGEYKHSLFADLKKLPSEKWRQYIYFNAELTE
jgi:hypothetical protein